MQRAPTLGGLFMLAALAMASAGCVPYERATRADTEVFEVLWRRDLSGLEQRLAAANQTGVDDAWTRVGEAWVALATCRPVDPHALVEMEDPDPVAELVHTSLVLEDLRRRRLLYWKGAGLRAKSISETIFARLDDPDFFVREPGDPPQGMIRWPERGGEAWADELPGPVAQPARCDAFYAEVFGTARAEARAYGAMQDKADTQRKRASDLDILVELPLRTRMHVTPQMLDDADDEQEGLAHLERRELQAAAQVAALYEALPASLREAPALDALAWRVRSHSAYLLGQIATNIAQQPDLNAEETAVVEALLARSDARRMPLVARELRGDPAPEQIPSTRRAIALMAGGVALIEAGEQTRGLKALRMADTIGLNRANEPLGRYLQAYALFKLQKWEELAALAEAPLAQGSRYYPPYVWRVGYALRKVGQTDRFMQWTMTAFRDTPYQSDPFLRALYVQMLEVLVRYPFEERILEVIEDLGPRARIYERVEEYASVALDRGRAANAAAAARWLLARHQNATYAPQYYATLALSAFLEDDIEAFEQHIDRMIARPKELAQAVGRRRQATFFAAADAQLATVFRQMIPIMAEWGDTEGARRARQRWLKVIVRRAQDFVRQTEETLARPALLDLYRIASSMLASEDARSYPEKVGELEPAPLVLGTVRVSERDLAPFEPTWRLTSYPLPSLTLIPRDEVPVAEWEQWWTPLEVPELAPPPEKRAPRSDEEESS